MLIRGVEVVLLGESDHVNQYISVSLSRFGTRDLYLASNDLLPNFDLIAFRHILVHCTRAASS